MECGVLTPLLSLSVAWQRTQKKNSKKQEKQRNKSGVTSPHSIKNATSKLTRRVGILVTLSSSVPRHAQFRPCRDRELRRIVRIQPINLVPPAAVAKGALGDVEDTLTLRILHSVRGRRTGLRCVGDRGNRRVCRRSDCGDRPRRLHLHHGARRCDGCNRRCCATTDHLRVISLQKRWLWFEHFDSRGKTRRRTRHAVQLAPAGSRTLIVRPKSISVLVRPIEPFTQFCKRCLPWPADIISHARADHRRGRLVRFEVHRWCCRNGHG